MSIHWETFEPFFSRFFSDIAAILDVCGAALRWYIFHSKIFFHRESTLEGAALTIFATFMNPEVISVAGRWLAENLSGGSLIGCWDFTSWFINVAKIVKAAPSNVLSLWFFLHVEEIKPKWRWKLQDFTFCQLMTDLRRWRDSISGADVHKDKDNWLEKELTHNW